MNPMGVCGAYGYIDQVLYVINDNNYPDIANDFWYNLFGCGGN